MPATTAYHANPLATRKPRSANHAAAQVTAITTGMMNIGLLSRFGSMGYDACDEIEPMMPGHATTKFANSNQMIMKAVASPKAKRVHT